MLFFAIFSEKMPKPFLSFHFSEWTRLNGVPRTTPSSRGVGPDPSFPDPGQPGIPTEPTVLEGHSLSFAKPHLT